MKFPPYRDAWPWLRVCIEDWDKLGDFNEMEQKSVRNLIYGRGGIKLGKYATALSMSMLDDEEVKRLAHNLVPPVHEWDNRLNLRPHDIASYYPPEDLQRDDDVVGAIAYFQGVHGDTKELLAPWILKSTVTLGLQKIQEHPTTLILAAAPYVAHRDGVSFPNTSWSMNKVMVENSLISGTWMGAEAISAWLRSGVLEKAMIRRLRDPNPLKPSDGWWVPGGPTMISGMGPVIPTIPLSS